MQRSAEQAAKNEATFRSVNEALEEKADALKLDDGPMPFLCECEDEHCTDVLLLQRGDYEGVRAHPRRFLVVPGHQDGNEQLIRDEAGFAIIEKHGEEGELVEQQDPRAAG